MTYALRAVHNSAAPPGLTGPDAQDVLSVAFLEHGPRLFSYLNRQVGQHAAEDVLSATFAAAWDRRTTFDPERGSLVGWLFGIASNQMRSMRRSWAREFQHEATVDAAARFEVLVHSEDLAEAAAHRVDAHRRIAELAVAIRELPEADREVLLLSAWAGLDPIEIAEALGIPAGTVRSRLHRARTRLKSL